MANETCDSCDENGNILRQDQVIPKECYIFNNVLLLIHSMVLKN